MNILEQIVSLSQYENAKNHTPIEYICYGCKSKLFTEKYKIQDRILHHKKNLYCSVQCFTKSYYNQDPLTREILTSLIEDGLSSYQIAKKLGRSQGSVSYWLTKLQLKTFKKPKNKVKRKNLSRYHISLNDLDNFNWPEIQQFYNLGKTWNDIRNHFGISLAMISFASKNGIFKTRTAAETMLIKNPLRIGRKMTQETKDKLSKARKAYLSANPDKCSWKRHSKFKSVPCELTKAKLRAYEIYFEDELEPLLHLGRHFSIDIAFPGKKIGFEINGGQHYKEGKLTPYYQKRHDLITGEGWILYEIPYHVAMRKDFVDNFILPILEGNFPKNYDTKLYQKEK